MFTFSKVKGLENVRKKKEYSKIFFHQQGRGHVYMYDSENSKALVRLLESADLVKMLEDLIAPSALSKLSPAVMSGVRVTLRNVREAILSCHDSLAAEQLKGHRPSVNDRSDLPEDDTTPFQLVQNGVQDPSQGPIEFTSKTSSGFQSQPSIPIRRNDLRSSLQKIVERS